MTYLACTSVGGGSDVSGWSDVDMSAFVVPAAWTIPIIMSDLATTIANLAGSGGKGGSTDTSSVPHFVAIVALQYPANSIMMIVTLVTLWECSLISFDRC